MSAYSFVVRDYPHSTPIKSGEYAVDGCDLRPVEVEPIHDAFSPMVQDLRFDICELAIATYLQAHEASKAISLLPIILSGDIHHHSLTRWSKGPAIAPTELRGKRVGVRAYSQTTGLWVRAVLEEEYGVSSGEITWVTTEGPHVSEYREPPNVERTSSTLVDLLRAGDIAAIVRGPAVLGDDDDALVPVIETPNQAEEAWLDRHHAVHMNHMLTVRTELLQTDPAAIRGVYDALCSTIDATRPKANLTIKQRSVTYGLSDILVASLEDAVRFALSQGLITTPVTIAELLADFEQYVGF